MRAWMSLVESWVRAASARTSSATTAKPRPCSPARAASMAALRASRLVCSAMPLITVSTASMLAVSWASCWMLSELLSTSCANWRITSMVASTTLAPSRACRRASSATCAALWALRATSWTALLICVAAVLTWSTDACSLLIRRSLAAVMPASEPAESATSPVTRPTSRISGCNLSRKALKALPRRPGSSREVTSRRTRRSPSPLAISSRRCSRRCNGRVTRPGNTSTSDRHTSRPNATSATCCQRWRSPSAEDASPSAAAAASSISSSWLITSRIAPNWRSLSP
ncbi:Uncharacterised protein [Klebsiella pneumoniae]|nr:Uncharacterised protein [Klebsiella pneumoniae]